MRSVTGLLSAALLVASAAAAQEPPVVTLAAANPARWDATGQAGWRGVNKGDIARERDDWYDAASFSGSLGYYSTSHLKVELEVATSTEGSIFVQEQIAVPGETFPAFRYGEHRFRSMGASAGLLYQFLENTWVHPFAGGGVELLRERARLHLQEQPACVRAPCLPVLLPSSTTVSYTAGPFVTAGVKLYVSERAFIRTDVRSTISTDGVDGVRWRAGAGVDF